MIIRKAQENELKIVQDLNHELFIYDSKHFDDLNLHWPYEAEGENYFRGVISGDLGICYVAEVDGEIIGYLAGRVLPESQIYTGRRAELDNMFVKESYRGRQVGGALVDNFFVWCKDNKVTYVMVNAYSPNTKAIEFYKRKGFEMYSKTLWKKL